jgi:large conductance mechanosensitive channel
MWSEFKAFLLKSNALALAIGVIIGAALGNVVNSLVVDILMPPIGKLLGRVDFSQIQSDLGDGVFIRWGAFITSVVSFVIVAFVVWLIARNLIREEAPAEAKNCPFCLEANAKAATKCRACASTI